MSAIKPPKSKSNKKPYQFKESDYMDTIMIYRDEASFRLETEKAAHQSLNQLKKAYLFTLQSKGVAQLFNNPYTLWIYEQEEEVYRDALLFQLEKLRAFL